MNRIILIGHAGKDPDVKTFGETKIATFTLATRRDYKDKNGKEQTDWHTIKAMLKKADIVEKIVRKGVMLCIEGKLEYSTYEKNGEKKVFAEIKLDNMKVLSKKEDREQVQSAQPSISIKPNMEEGIQKGSQEAKELLAKTEKKETIYEPDEEETDLPF